MLLLSSMHTVDFFLLLEAYGLFFHYVYGKTNHKLCDLVYATNKPARCIESGSGQDEKLIINFMWPSILVSTLMLDYDVMQHAEVFCICLWWWYFTRGCYSGTHLHIFVHAPKNHPINQFSWSIVVPLWFTAV